MLLPQSGMVPTELCDPATGLSVGQSTRPLTHGWCWLQAYTGEGLDQKVAAKEVNSAAIAALMNQLAISDVAAEPVANSGWIAGPVIGGVAAAAILAGVVWFLYKKNAAAQPPAAFNTAGTDAAVRIHRVADKYVVQQPEHLGSDGGIVGSTAQVSRTARVRNL